MSLRQAFSDKSSEDLSSTADSNDGDFELRVTDVEEEEEAADEEDAVRTNKKKNKIRHRWAGMLGEEENKEEDADAARLSAAAATASGEAAAHVRYMPV